MKIIILNFLLLISISSFGQKACGYKIDEEAILGNKNLDAFLIELKSQEFAIQSDKNEIPNFIKKFLDCNTGSFSIANPNEKFQDGCVVQKKLPKRQLTFLAKSKNILVMTYLTGGIGISSHFLFVKFEKGKIIDLWSATGMGMTKPSSIKQIVDYVNKFRNADFGLKPNPKYL